MTKKKPDKARAKGPEAEAPTARAPVTIPGLPVGEQEAREYIDGLLIGKTKPQNRYVGDVVEQIREARRELNDLRNRIDDFTNGLAQARERRVALLGIVQQLCLNLVKWKGDKPTDKPT